MTVLHLTGRRLACLSAGEASRRIAQNIESVSAKAVQALVKILQGQSGSINYYAHLDMLQVLLEDLDKVLQGQIGQIFLVDRLPFHFDTAVVR